MKARCGMTKHQIAEKSGVPFSTVERVFSGRTDNPTFHPVVDIVRAMGGSLNELDDVLPPAVEASPSTEKVPEKVLEMYEKQIAQYEKQIKQKDKWLKGLILACAALAAVIVGVLLLDVLTGHVGFFRF